MAAAFFLLASGCATPRLQSVDPQLLLGSDLLSFIKDGATSREETVLRLGIPAAQIEGDRILMYQLRRDPEGKWHMVAPGWNPFSGLRTWSEGTGSLVLVFGQDGLLLRHSLVLGQNP